MKPFVITRILAPTDLSASSLPALRYACLFADRFGAKLSVMYADPIVYPVDFAGMHEPFLTAAPQHEEQLREEVRQHVLAVMGDRRHDVAATVGQPVPAILRTAEDQHADLIIMGTHLRHGWRRALLGSVSDGVVHGSRCPVLTVASQDRLSEVEPYSITNVLCPVNFTEVAHDSLHAAARIAEAFGAHLTLVHVLDPEEVTNVTADERRIREWVGPELQRMCTYRELVVRGGPAERVLDCADDVGADLLVIGAQHKLFRDSTVIGTTTERLIRFASAPVLVVPREVVRREQAVKKEVENEQLAGVVW